MLKLNNKNILITGAGSGIGQALALKLNERGNNIIAIDICNESLENTLLKSKIKENIFTFKMDVSQLSEWNKLKSTLQKETILPDIIINNAGKAMSDIKIEKVNYDDFKQIIDTNFWGVFYGTKEFLPLLKSKEEAGIINVSSIYGITACANASAYTTSKFAVRGFTETLRQELIGTNVYIACVFPGGIKTNIARNALLAIGTDPDIDLIEKIKKFENKTQTTSEEAASTIIEGIMKKQKRILIGKDAKIMDLLARLQPVNYDKFMFKHIINEN